MSLHTLLAHEVRSKGRGDDTMLIHMTPGEVGGLQALAMAHGGSLSINPNTGLPEAGFLKNILPTLLGIGLSFIPGVGPLMAAGIVGGGTTLATGDIGKGLTAGLGAFGGAGLGAGLGAAGAAGSAGAAGASNIAGTALTPAASYAGSNLAGAAGAATAPSTFMGNLSQAGTGLQNLFSSGVGGQAARDAFLGQAANKATNTAATGLGGGIGAVKTAGALAAQIPPPEIKIPEAEDPYANYEGPYIPTDRNVYYPDENDLRTSREFTYFDPSNPVPFAKGGETTDRALRTPGADYNVNQGEFDYNFQPVQIAQGAGNNPSVIGGKGGIGGKGNLSRFASLIREKTQGKTGAVDRYQYDPNTQKLMRRYAQGGLTAFAGGRFLEGPGDGTSDDIPAIIGSRQPARLADGEFVIDARTVSEIGNGSSNAGAKKLYAMMNRVHNERKKAQRGKNSAADKYLPA